METISQLVTGYVLNSVWQVTVITALAVLCSLFVRRASGRHRHILWVLCLGACVAIPVVTAVRQVGVAGKPDSAAPVAGEDDGHATISRQGGWSFLSFRSRTRPVQFTTAFVSILAGVYFALLLLRCLQLGWIFRRTLHLRRLAHERTAPAALACAAETCQRLFAIPAVPLLCSEEVASPSTLGWRRPVLLVPANLFTDQIGEEDAISALGHEMAHIQRRDFGLNLLYEVVSVPLWFHPATTLIKARIAQTRELACDEMAARLLPSGKQYARSLLHMAQNMFAAAPSAKSNYAMGLFDTHALEERIMNILRVPRGGKRASRTRMGIAVALLGAVSLLCSAFSLRVAPDTASVDIHRFVGTWVTKHKGQTFITIKLKSENGKLGGTCTHVDRVDYVDGELIPSSDQYVEQEIVEAKVSGNKVDLRIGGHDSIYVEFTLKGTNDADVITVADSPDAGDSQDQGPPQKKPWHFERVADGR